MEANIKILEKKIELLKELDTTFEIFYPPSLKSEYKKSNLESSLEDLEKFEKQFQIELPPAYKLFVDEIGDGNFDVLPLHRYPGESTFVKNNFENLKLPFPHSEEWEEESLEEFKEKFYNKKDYLSYFIDIPELTKKYLLKNKFKEKSQLDMFEFESFQLDDNFFEYLFDEYYYSDAHLNGSIYFQDLGCNIREIIVVTGKRKGTIWVDDRANGVGIYPSGTFYQWFNRWLDEKIRDLEKV